MLKIENVTSPNFSDEAIPVEFLVLHYTACDLRRTLEIFLDPDKKVCAHFVLDTDGTCYDLGNFLTGPIRKGAHAGESRLTVAGKNYDSFNKMSIGIEIVNLNGNLFPYTETQYASLQLLLNRLIQRFPVLLQPGRIVGHEHVAGFRGKCDPGVLFDWNRILTAVGATPEPFHRTFAATSDDLRFAREAIGHAGQKESEFWSGLSSNLEARIKARNQ